MLQKGKRGIKLFFIWLNDTINQYNDLELPKNEDYQIYLDKLKTDYKLLIISDPPGQNEGIDIMASIRKRGNSYQITVSNGRDSSGKQLIETATFTPDPDKTEKQNQKALEKIRFSV